MYYPLLSLLLLALSPSLSKSSYLKSFHLQDGLLRSSSHVEGCSQPSACLSSGNHPRAAMLCACSALTPSLPLDCGLPEHKPGSPRCPPGQAEPRYKVGACFPTPSPNNPPSFLLEGGAGDCRVYTAAHPSSSSQHTQRANCVTFCICGFLSLPLPPFFLFKYRALELAWSPGRPGKKLAARLYLG